MRLIRNVALSLVIGALFGWAMSTKFPLNSALISGAGAGAFMYGGLVYNERLERRELRRRAGRRPEDQEA